MRRFKKLFNFQIFCNICNFNITIYTLLILMLYCKKIALSNLYIVTVLKNQFCVKIMRKKNIKRRETKEIIF